MARHDVRSQLRVLLVLATLSGIDVSSRALAAEPTSEAPAPPQPSFSCLDSARTAWTRGEFDDVERLAHDCITALAGPHPDTLLIDRAQDLLIGARAARNAAARGPRRERPHAVLADTLQAIATVDTFAMGRMETAQHRVVQRMLERSLALRESLSAPEDVNAGRAVHMLGNAVSQLGDYQRGLALFERALRIHQKVEGPHGRAHNAEGNIALMRRFLGDLGEARRIYEGLLAEMEQNHPDKSVLLSGRYMQLCDVYVQLEEDPRQIRRLLERCIEIRRAAGMSNEWLSDPLIRLAATYTSLGDPGRAVAVLDSLSAGFALRPDRSNIGDIETRRADALLALGRYREAEKSASSALAQRTATWGSDNPWLMEPCLLMAKTRIGLREWPGAVAAAESAVAIGRRWFPELHPDQGRTLLALAQATAGLGERKRAFDLALEAEARLRDALYYVSPGLGEAAAFRMDRDRGLALGLAATLISPRNSAADRRSLLDAIVRSRAVVLDVQVSRIQSASPDSAGRQLRNDYERACTRLANLVMRQGNGETLKRDQREVEEARIARHRSEVARAAGSSAFSLQHERARAGLEEVLAALPADASLVSFVRHASFDTTARAQPPGGAGSWRYAAFVVRPGGGDPSCVPLGDAETIDRLVERWRNDVGHGSSRRGRGHRRSGLDLRRAIWDPVAAAAGGATAVVMVTDGSLQMVNFAVLPTAGDRYLIESGPRIVTLTAERDAVHAHARARGTGLLALGGVDYERATPLQSNEPAPAGPRLSSGETYRSARASCTDFQALKLAPLPATGPEVAEIAGLWRIGVEDSASLVLSGASASEDRFKRLAHGFRFLHVATHGFFLPPACDSANAIVGAYLRDAPLLRSGLALSGFNERNDTHEGQEDGVLTAEEIAALDLSGVDGVVLSACESGVGVATAGEGVLGLRRAFQAAGAGTLVTSLWPVRDLPALGWMRVFYASLARGGTPAKAAYQASRAMLSRLGAKERAEHPADWGAFMVVGGGR